MEPVQRPADVEVETEVEPDTVMVQLTFRDGFRFEKDLYRWCDTARRTSRGH